MNALTADRIGVERRVGGERRRTRLPEGTAGSWATLLREASRVYASEILSVIAGLFLASMILLAVLFNARWKTDRCVEALKAPSTDAAVLMAVCR